MPSDTSSPSAGIYHIRNAASNELLNLVRRQPLDKPTAFTCKVTGSPTQKWELESRPGQPSGSKSRIRNIVADLYLAHNRIAALDSNSDNVLALPDAFNWKLTKIGEGY
ncbi:hypothetical protein FRC02_010847 [Tulasnella sp. 418]|nr:hypothetical protein FRC02_010847 [Tulasnella sp. 418]